MDVGAYAELICERSLPQWQKEFLQKCYDKMKSDPNAKLIVSVSQDSYRDFVVKCLEFYNKELTQNGKTFDSRNTLSTMR